MDHCNVPETHDYSVPKISFNYINRTSIIRGYSRQHSMFQHHFLQATHMAFYPLGNYQLLKF